MSVKIPLYRYEDGFYRPERKYAIVDKNDAAVVLERTDLWLIHSEGYAYTYVGNKSKPLLMHRFVLGLTNPKVHTDHKNHNRLDNRRSNIVACTQAENNQNLPFTGVGWHKQRNKWRAWSPQKQGNPYKHLGLFNTKQEAERAVATWLNTH